MEKIASFTINHLKLLPGVYVSRKDAVGSETLTTFDLRMTAPNREPVMNTAEMHAIEHLAATYLRNNKEWQDKIIYFGPMGCRTGFYLILAGDLTSKDILPLIISTFEFIRDYRHKVLIPAAMLISIITLVFGQLLVTHIFTFRTTLSIIVNFVGGVYFIYLLLRANKKWQ